MNPAIDRTSHPVTATRLATDAAVALEAPPLDRLRWLTIVLPGIALLVVDALGFAVEHSVARGAAQEIIEHTLLAVVPLTLMVPFSLIVFRLFGRTYATVVVQNETLAALHARTLKQSAQLHAVDEAGLALVSDLSLQVVLQRVVDLSRELLNASYAELRVREDRTGGAQLLTSGQAPAIGVDAAERRLLRVPIAFNQRTIGELLISDPRADAFESEDEALLTLFAAHAAVAIENARLHSAVEGYTVLEERARIAREMHDSFAQVLGYVSTKAQAVRAHLAVDGRVAATSELLELEDAIQRLYTDVRESIFGLRSAHVAVHGFDGEIASYAREFGEHTGIETHIEVEDALFELHASPVAEAHVMRIVQEALTNARIHASAAHVWVRIGIKGDKLEVAVTDDGVGFDQRATDLADQRFGLRIMWERAQLIGATLSVESAPGAGTRVAVALPLAEVSICGF